MLIVESRNAIVLKPDNAAQITSCIPSARPFNYKGQKLLYIPHNLDETKVLRNLGISVPSPMGYQYNWPRAQGKYAPFVHQRATSEFLTFHQRAAILNAPRTGKTNSCLWSADYLMHQKLVRKVLVVCPLSTMDMVWAAEIFSSFWWRKAVVLYGDKARRLKLLQQEADFYIVNHDGFAIIKDSLPSDVDLVIYDEAAVLRNPSTIRFRQFYNFMDTHPAMRLWLLTGTPTPNEPTDAWSLCKLLGSSGLPRYTLFREQVMMKIAMWTWKPRPGSEQVVSQFLQPSIRYTREECFDLPPTTYETRQCELTPVQKKLFMAMMRQLATEVKGQQVTAVNEASKVQKLLQILLGGVYTDAGGTVTVDCAPRIDIIREVVEECSEKVIVFVPFTAALHGIAEALGKHFKVAVVNGSVSKNQRNEIFKSFVKDPHLRVLVADARCMQHGLDMTPATTIIWAGPTNSNETYEQACDRIKGPKQLLKTQIVHIEATEIERRAFKRLRDRQSMQGLLLDIIQNQAELI